MEKEKFKELLVEYINLCIEHDTVLKNYMELLGDSLKIMDPINHMDDFVSIKLLNLNTISRDELYEFVSFKVWGGNCLRDFQGNAIMSTESMADWIIVLEGMGEEAIYKQMEEKEAA